MFLARENELDELNYRYDRGEFECMIIYGRRRVGKTALINEFCKDRKVIYFPALKDTVQGNLDILSQAINTYKDPDSHVSVSYNSFQDAFTEIGRIAERERVIFVIDEYPYLAKADLTISSRLQHLIDLSWSKGKMFLILCGSSVSFMEGEVLSYESPLYGRRTGQIHLMPLSYRDSARFVPGLDPVTKAEVYGITGGIPLYLNKLDVKKDLKSALLRNFFNTSSYLFEEPENLLKQELREPALYNAVIKAIAEGATKLSEISTKTGMETSSCSTYVHTLVGLGIIEKETPLGKKEGGRSIYRISDPFFRFWYRFVPRNMGAIATGRIRNTFDRSVGDYLHDYMGLVFEDMCAQYLMMYDDSLPINLNRVGRWWGTDPKKRKEIEIDLIGEPVQENNDQKKEYIAASCKFRNGHFTMKDLDELKEYSMVFCRDAEFHYYVFYISDVADDVKDLAKREGIRLVSLEQVF